VINRTPSVVLICVVAWLALLAGGCTSGATPRDHRGPAAESDRWAGTPLNQIQVIGSHNSYKRAIQRELYELIEQQYAISLDSVDYAHIPLADQFNLGLRNLELDVYHDPDGGRYADPPAHRLLRAHGIQPDPWDPENDASTPGFKVLHDADVDFATWHVAFEKALRELRRWSQANPGHLPVLVTMNCKHDESRRFPGAKESVPFDVEALRALDAVIAAELDGHLLTPDMVRAGHETLRDAITTDGWPAADAVSGRFYFLLDHGGTLREDYRRAFPGGRRASMFVSGHPDADDAAVFVRNEPIEDEAAIRSLVAQGFIVRTRADAGTAEPRAESFERFEAAKRSRAQVITTDYYIPDRSISDRFIIRFDDGGFTRPLPSE
jgi:hypothetical protein